MSLEQDLAIRGESIQRIYQYYLNETFLVNRRYQRKLVWSIEEKQKFIDSLVNGYPVPIILLANIEYNHNNKFEIIDGMQRLNAITSFIENEYDIFGSYFDLETMVETKNLLDSRVLEQKQPILDRKICSKIASYSIPLSVYTINDNEKIDDIFKRVNAYGKHLSKQELRVAGSLCKFASLVRRIAAEIRRDTSQNDILLLNNMKEISITNVKLSYGILVDKIFWVENYILTKEMVRESKDEEVISDIIANIIFPGRQPTNTENRDAFYGFYETELTTRIEDGITKVGEEIIHTQIIKTYDIIRELLSHSQKNFRDLVSTQAHAQRLPRYFTIIFLAIHELVFKDGKEVSDLTGLIKKLNKITNYIKITTGGNWSSKNIESNVNAVTGIIKNCFKKSKVNNPATQKWTTEFETILMQSRVENVLYDFKQGFLNVDGNQKFNAKLISQTVKTLIAMCNTMPGSTGYVCIGVTDKQIDAEKIKSIYGVEPIIFNGYRITGIGHEAKHLNITLDIYFQKVVNIIRKEPITKEAITYILGNIRLITYYDKEVILLKLKSIDVPRLYDDEFYIRYGANIEKLQKRDLANFIKNYQW